MIRHDKAIFSLKGQLWNPIILGNI
jgi:hypothetical protein